MKTGYKYSPKKPTIIVYMILICIGLLLTIGRWVSVFNNDFVIFNDEINSHISNLSLSLLIYLTVGYLLLLLGVRFQIIIILGVFLIVANLISETFIGFMNTPDIIDAIYGIIGISVAFLFLFVTNKFGLIQN